MGGNCADTTGLQSGLDMVCRRENQYSQQVSLRPSGVTVLILSSFAVSRIRYAGERSRIGKRSLRDLSVFLS